MREYHQADYHPENPLKYIGNKLPFFRSSWEKRFFYWLDTNMTVLRWSSETIKIPYFFSLDQQMHKYIPDIYAEIKSKDGDVKKYLIEVKPDRQTREPKKPKTNHMKSLIRYNKEKQLFIKNKEKWGAAEFFCRQKGWNFRLITEKTLF